MRDNKIEELNSILNRRCWTVNLWHVYFGRWCRNWALLSGIIALVCLHTCAKDLVGWATVTKSRAGPRVAQNGEREGKRETRQHLSRSLPFTIAAAFCLLCEIRILGLLICRTLSREFTWRHRCAASYSFPSFSLSSFSYSVPATATFLSLNGRDKS